MRVQIRPDDPWVILDYSETVSPGFAWVDAGHEVGSKLYPTPYAILYRDELNRLWKEREESTCKK